MGATIPVQIATCQIEKGSAQNPHPHDIAGVCGTCTGCGAAATAPVATAGRGGPVTRRKAAVRAVLEALADGCERRLPWGSTPVHFDCQIPTGVTLFALEVSTGDRQPVAVDERGKLVTAWAGVHPAAVVLVVPAGDSFAAAAGDFAWDLREKRGYAKARVGTAEVKEPTGA